MQHTQVASESRIFPSYIYFHPFFGKKYLNQIYRSQQIYRSNAGINNLENLIRQYIIPLLGRNLNRKIGISKITQFLNQL